MTCFKRGTKPLWKRVVRAIAVFVLSFTVLSMAASAVIFHAVFGRDWEKENPLVISYADLDTIRYPRQEHRFASGENTLQGYWYQASEQKGIVVIVHGLGGNAQSHLAEATYFLDHGLCVFAYDGTGTGGSEGEGIVGLTQSKLDAAAAVSYVRSVEKSLPIYLYGHSAGGYGAVAALEMGADVDAVVCVAGYRSPVRMMHGSAKKYVGILADVQYPFLQLQNWFTFGADADADAAQVAAQSEIPVFFICGSEDNVIPDNAKLDESCANDHVTYKLISQAYRSSHTTIWLSADAAQYWHEMREKLKELEETAGGELSAAQLAEFSQQVDKARISQLDEGLMGEILQFYFGA